MFYDSYREEDLEALYENDEDFNFYEEDEYRQDRYEEMTTRFGGGY
jgi:hypothetical protein